MAGAPTCSLLWSTLHGSGVSEAVYVGDMFGTVEEQCTPCPDDLSDLFGVDDLEQTTTLRTPAAQPQVRLPDPPASSRGRYVRDHTRCSHAEYAWNHLQQMRENTSGVPCDDTCPFDRRCGRNFTPATLERAHERVYGPGVTFADGKYHCRRSQKETHKQWRALMLSWVTNSASDGASTECFKVVGVGPVCSCYVRAIYFGLDSRQARPAYRPPSRIRTYMHTSPTPPPTSQVQGWLCPHFSLEPLFGSRT